ncbi:hypothetical protein J517_3836 [Acinetobacter baumannii 118362]|nr:hypothetical protein J517_3836 [Acinetobacter baumannii 118362]
MLLIFLCFKTQTIKTTYLKQDISFINIYMVFKHLKTI